MAPTRGPAVASRVKRTNPINGTRNNTVVFNAPTEITYNIATTLNLCVLLSDREENKEFGRQYAKVTNNAKKVQHPHVSR
jgi:hypothetical protein